MLSSTGALAIALALRTVSPQSVAVPNPAPDRPITHFFQNLAGDVRRLPSADTTVLLAAGAGAALVAHRSDRRIATWEKALGRSRYGDIGAVVGDGWLQGSAALVTYAAGAIRHNGLATHIGSDLIRAQALNAVLTTGLKVVADRSRPSGGGRSFPSGHTSASFASAAVLAEHLGWRVGVPAYAGAALIGWTRVRDDHHWLSDVIAGSALGLVAGRTVTSGHGDRQWAVVPSASASHVAIQFVRLAKPRRDHFPTARSTTATTAQAIAPQAVSTSANVAP